MYPCHYRMMARYCFVEFADPMTAKSALYNLKKESMPGCASVSIVQLEI